MKSLQQVKESYKSETLDGRDLSRLIDFFPLQDWEHFGFELKDGAEPPVPKDWTRENILEQLKGDVAFGFQKALNQRGISAELMYSVVQMWNWVLEEGLEDFDEYAQYGLPLFKATAEKYGFPNPIGEKKGNEFRYSSDYEGE